MVKPINEAEREELERPTDWPAGSVEKLELIRRRHEAKLPLWVEGDNPYFLTRTRTRHGGKHAANDED